MEEKTIFEKILDKQIPCKPVYEDEDIFAFNDIAPIAPIHILIIPKKKIINVSHMLESDAQLTGKILLAAKKIAQKLKVDNDGYRLIFNNGPRAGQTVFYMHCHFIAGRDLSWPPG